MTWWSAARGRPVRLQEMPHHRLAPGTLVALAIGASFLAAIGLIVWRMQPPERRAAESTGPAASSGGATITASLRSEPRTFNRFIGRDFASEVLTFLLHAKLARVNRASGELEPWLAERWTVAAGAGGQVYTLELRKGVRFSDGFPFSAADVLFSFEAAYDEKTGSPLRELLLVDGRPLKVSAPDPSTIVIEFPAAFGPGLRLLDNLPILPKHRLREALHAGTLRDAWPTSTPPSELAGLGPFVLERYEPGRRLTFARNPHYWRRDAAGMPLPRVDRLVLDIVPDQNAEIVRLDAGQIDFTQSEVRAEDYAIVKRAADAGRLRLIDLGVGLDADALWFNLGQKASSGEGQSDRPWLRSRDLRRAISHAIDRQAFADTVFLGAAVPIWGPITAADRQWYADGLPRDTYDPARAAALLAGLGLSDRTGDGVREDQTGRPARFSLLTQKGNTALERGSAFIRDELAKIGLTIDVVPLEVGSLVERLTSGDYDAIYFRFLRQDTDPAMNLDFWLSSGGAHVWHPGQQRPATPWEARIDELMRRQARSLDPSQRRRLFEGVQRELAAELPILYFAAPRVFVAMSRRIERAMPSVMRPNILWHPDELSVR